MRSVLQIFICASLLFLCSACRNRGGSSSVPVKLAEVKAWLQEPSKLSEWEISKVDCKTPTDTLYQNLPYSFYEGLQQLRLQFNKIDSSGYNVKTAELLKSLVIGDFVYAAFSYQFLGPDMGLESDTVCNWNSLPLEAFYNLGNTNQTSLYCVERTAFFLRLTDSLLHIKGSPIAVSNFHTYPVLYIQGDTFIIDPYDPFIISDSSGATVRTYSDLLRSPDAGTYAPLRTQRLFGNTHQLISRRFTDSIETACKTGRNDCLCESLHTYLINNEAKLRGFVKPCFNMPNQPLYNTLKVLGTGSTNNYIMEMTGRVDGQLSTSHDLLRYYAGRVCDTVSISK
jgi:hypothetical protein